MPLLEIPSSLAISYWLIFLAIFKIFILISLEIFAMILDVRIFTIFKKKSELLLKNILHISSGTFSSVLKKMYLDWFMCGG